MISLFPPQWLGMIMVPLFSAKESFFFSFHRHQLLEEKENESI